MLASAPLFPKFVSEDAAMYHEVRKRGTSGLAVAIKELVAITQPLPGRVANNANSRTGASVHDHAGEHIGL
jgi:hypothetical protein